MCCLSLLKEDSESQRGFFVTECLFQVSSKIPCPGVGCPLTEVKQKMTKGIKSIAPLSTTRM